MMKKISLFVLIMTNFFFLSFIIYNGETDYWEVLETTKIKNKFNPVTEQFDKEIKFLNKLKKIDGQKIKLKGFISPKTSSKEKVILSKHRSSGNGCCSLVSDIRRLVKIKAMEGIEFKIGEVVTLEGNLKLNATDPSEFMYVLESARCLDCVD